MRKLDEFPHRCRANNLKAAALLLVACIWSQAVLAQDVRRPSRRLLPQITAVSTPEEQGMDSTTLAAGIEVHPDENLVIGLNAGSGIGDYWPITAEFLDTWVLGAIESDGSLPPNPDGVALLASRVSEAAASNEGPPQAVGTLPATAQTISGQTYNLWQWDLRFEGDTVALTLESLAGGELPATATGTLAR